MMNRNKVSLSLKGLEEFKEGLDQYRARVGVLGSDTNRKDASGITNSELGVVHMYGSVTRNIPPRDFLVMPIEINRKEMSKRLTSKKLKSLMEAKDFKKVYEIIGITAEQYVQQGFETGGFGQWPQNKPSTVHAKGSSKPLIDTSQLRRSISSDVVKASEVG